MYPLSKSRSDLQHRDFVQEDSRKEVSLAIVLWRLQPSQHSTSRLDGLLRLMSKLCLSLDQLQAQLIS